MGQPKTTVYFVFGGSCSSILVLTTSLNSIFPFRVINFSSLVAKQLVAVIFIAQRRGWSRKGASLRGLNTGFHLIRIKNLFFERHDNSPDPLKTLLRTVPTAHMFCATRGTRLSCGWCLLIQGYFYVV